MLPKARTKGVLVQEIGDELVVYDMERKEAHRLSPSAALVWRNADGKHTPEQLARIVEAELDVPGSDVLNVALDELRRSRLVEGGVTVGVSRRAAMAKLAAAGVAALLVPSVLSIAAPTARAQQSGPAACTPDPSDPFSDVDGDGVSDFTEINDPDRDPCVAEPFQVG